MLRVPSQPPPEFVLVRKGDAVLPVEDFVLIKFDPLAEETDGGLVMAGRRGSKYEGIVVEVGPGKDGAKLFIAPGDRVVFLPHAGIPVRQGDANLIILRQDAIFAVVGPVHQGRQLYQRAG